MQLLQPFRNTGQVMLEPVSHQKRFAVGGFDDVLQSVKLAVVDADEMCIRDSLAFRPMLYVARSIP